MSNTMRKLKQSGGDVDSFLRTAGIDEMRDMGVFLGRESNMGPEAGMGAIAVRAGGLGRGDDIGAKMGLGGGMGKGEQAMLKARSKSLQASKMALEGAAGGMVEGASSTAAVISAIEANATNPESDSKQMVNSLANLEVINAAMAADLAKLVSQETALNSKGYSNYYNRPPVQFRNERSKAPTQSTLPKLPYPPTP